MVKKILFISIIIAMVICSLNYCFADSNDYEQIIFNKQVNPESHNGKICSVPIRGSVEFWHYSKGYWGGNVERLIFDNEGEFWLNPEKYQFTNSLMLEWSFAVPNSVKEFITNGGKVIVEATTNDGIIRYSETDQSINPYYSISDDTVYVRCMPQYNVVKGLDFRDYVDGLNNVIPIVADPYGKNRYAIYSKITGEHLGWASGTLTNENYHIDYTDILNSVGELKPGKVIKVTTDDYKLTREFNSDEILIGLNTFQDAGAVSMYFEYPIEVSFYKAKSTVDFEIVSHEPGKSKQCENITSVITVKNNSDISFMQDKVNLNFYNGSTNISADFFIGANSTQTIQIDWRTPCDQDSVVVEVNVNPDMKYGEKEFDNNIKQFEISLIEEKPVIDVRIDDISPKKYPAASIVTTLIKITNDSDEDFAAGDAIDLQFAIPDINIIDSQQVSIAARSTQVVAFQWKTPDQNTTVRITAVADPGQKILERNKENNIYSIDANIEKNDAPNYNCDVTRREWSEKRFSHYEYYETASGREKKRAVYVTKYFYAQVGISAEVKPVIGNVNSMKSGYGYELIVKTTISTNYDKNGVYGFQSIYAYVAGDNFTYPIQLTRGNDINTYTFPLNSESVENAQKRNVQYVPISWPDNSYYDIKIVGRDATSPGGSMCANTSARIYIQGSLYEDDNTSVGQ